MTDLALERDMTRCLAQILRAAIEPGRPACDVKMDITLARFSEARHKIAPLLWSLAKQDCFETDVETSAFLRDSYRHAGLFIARQQSTRTRLKRIFAESDIRYVEFKGRGLAEQLYDDPAGRFSKDIDIIVGKKCRGRALNVLHEAGFFRSPDGPSFSTRKAAIAMWSRKDASMFDPVTGVQVELHQRLFASETDGLSEAFVNENIADTIPQINNAFYILYLILHGAHAHWASLRRVLDVPLIFKKNSPETSAAVFDLAHKYQCTSAVSASVRFANSVFPDAIDESWAAQANRFCTSKSQVLEASFNRFLFHPLNSSRRTWYPLDACYIYDGGINYLREVPKRIVTMALNRI